MTKGPIYLCGPMDNCSDIETHAWRYEATKLLGEAYVLDPTRRVFKGRILTAEEKRHLVESDLEDLKNCAGVLCNYWKAGVGTTMELVYAKLWRKPVVALVPYNDYISPWLEYHTNDITRYTIADGIDKLKKLLRWDASVV